MSDKNQPIVENDQNLISKELLAKEAIKIMETMKWILKLKKQKKKMISNI